MPPTRRPDQSWHHSLTLDLLLRVLKNSVFHPFVASLAPLCLAAGGYPLSHIYIKNTIYWAIFICILSILSPFNERIAYGPRRKVEHDDEVIVITGGANGLGKCLASTYAMKGATVAVLDIQPPSSASASASELDDASYFHCDISSATAVRSAWASICKTLGPPTVLINCAGLVHGKLAAQLSDEDVLQSFATNTLSHYRLNALFLSSLPSPSSGGTIVTVSSVLASLGAARLSAYTATKSALTAYHRSLTAELRSSHPNVKTILVSPGQLSTEMFAGPEQGPMQRFFGPVVEVSDLAVRIVRMTSEGSGGVIAEPAYARWIALLELLPVGVQRVFREWAGVDGAMGGFQGRGKGREEEKKKVGEEE